MTRSGVSYAARLCGKMKPCSELEPDYSSVWDANPKKFIANSSTENLKEIWSARHDTQVGRWVTVFKAQWSPYADVAPHVAVCR